MVGLQPIMSELWYIEIQPIIKARSISRCCKISFKTVAHLLLTDHLDIDKIKIAIGGSFGGNQALEFAYSYSGNIENLILVASSAKESAWSIAVHETQRMAMKSDSMIEGG